MIPAGAQIYIALEAIDMRMGLDRLCGVVRERMGYEPRGGALFVFVNRRRHTLKILFADGTGICVFHKRLDAGQFPRPRVNTGAEHAELEPSQLDALLDGLPFEPEEEPPCEPSRLSKRRPSVH